MPSVTGQGARSLSLLLLKEAASSALLPLPPTPPLVPMVSAVCSLQVSGGHSRGEGLVAWAMTDSRLGRSTGAIPPPPPPFLPPRLGAGAEAALFIEDPEEVRRAALVWDAILPHLRCTPLRAISPCTGAMLCKRASRVAGRSGAGGSRARGA